MKPHEHREVNERIKVKARARLRRAGFSVTNTESGDLLISGNGYTVLSYYDEVFKQWRLVPYSEPIRQIIHGTVQQYKQHLSAASR